MPVLVWSCSSNYYNATYNIISLAIMLLPILQTQKYVYLAIDALLYAWDYYGQQLKTTIK